MKKTNRTGLVVRQSPETNKKYRIVLALMKELGNKSSLDIADDIWESGVNLKYNDLQKTAK